MRYFPGYYKPHEGQFYELWQSCIFSPDANVLLNLYRYTLPTRNRLLEVFTHGQERLWLTHQAAYEFHKNRLTVISQQQDAYDSIRAEFTKNLADTLNRVKQQYQKHSYLDVQALEGVVADATDKLSHILQSAKAQHPDFGLYDPVLERVTSLFRDSVGDPYSPTDLAKKLKEAEERFGRKQPPGFEDAKTKPEPDKYGDVLVWFQLLDYATQHKKPIVFITDDKKDDWWHRHKGQTIGPRPELVHEMRAVADVEFYMYTPDRFLAYAESYFHLSKQDEAIEEAREVSERILWLSGRGAGGGWPGKGMYMERLNRNAIAARRLGIRDAATINDFDEEAFWTWAAQRGLPDRSAVETVIGSNSSAMTPWELRAAIVAKEEQDSEKRRTDMDALMARLQEVGITSRDDLERLLEAEQTLQEYADHDYDEDRSR